MGCAHLLMASTSSVYGANEAMPFRETDKADTQLYDLCRDQEGQRGMGHVYAHLWGIPTTMFRFFTVYGPWGRPDLALFKFTDAILDGRPIDIYNHGEMYRDFTHVRDLVRGIRGLIDAVPERPASSAEIAEGDSLSPVAPFRIVNIGNSEKVRLLDFVEAIEEATGRQGDPELHGHPAGRRARDMGGCVAPPVADGLPAGDGFPRRACGSSWTGSGTTTGSRSPAERLRRIPSGIPRAGARFMRVPPAGVFGPR